MSGTTAFSVVIATRNRPAPLARCLAALGDQTLGHGQYEIIIVDDGGDAPLDGVIEPFRERMDVRLVRRRHGGPAAARNTGAEHARGRFLAFTDDDCRPVPDWLARLHGRLDTDPTALWGGRVVNGLDDNIFAAASQRILEASYAHHNPRPEDAAFFASNNMALPADGFRHVGGFDPTFDVASEDRDLCARWGEAGLRIGYAPHAVVVHEHDLSLTGFCRQHFRYGRGAWQFHHALHRRGRGRLRRDLAFHIRFLSTALPRGAGTLRMAALLGLWQIVNAAGFAREAAARRR